MFAQAPPEHRVNPANPNVDTVSFELRIVFHDAAPAYQVDNASALPSPRFEMLSNFRSIRISRMYFTQCSRVLAVWE